MKPPPSLDDLSLFLRVADAGSLSAASQASGVSLPTLGRHMTRLEAHLGRRLFLRGAKGYALTAEGRALAEEALALRAAEERIHRWRDGGSRAVRVRITAGNWTSRFLARHIARFWSADAPWVPEFVASNRNVDIARREADIGIRNRRPEQDWMAGRRTLRIDYAEYGTDPAVAGYITLRRDGPTTPSERWLWRTRAEQVVMQASDARLAMDLATSGAGRVILPTFVGDAEPALRRLSPPIAEISHEEWLVSHHEARNDPPVRAALDALTRVLTDRDLRPAPV
ncbi:LysR family transcriptional regulator [Tropicimonas isoalkanivorans]|uniref:Transcriptional regulator, LysR family n=1 Tax=Tropicimonas isoalkanivorans TaxID=441112 RepID=A0A1I1G385_9RHOB|nr:LysR family transcriptional regulator [Tropicimonas isoalkanivorans]SFC04288.1 transcriptional regulator, LysR family [Tropicimonas isoalkanivorans]